MSQERGKQGPGSGLWRIVCGTHCPGASSDSCRSTPAQSTSGFLLLLKGAQKCSTPSASCSISWASECSGRTAENGRSSSHVRAGPAKICHIDLNEPKTKEQSETRTSQPGKVVAHSQDPTRPRITEAHLPGLRHNLGREASGNPVTKVTDSPPANGLRAPYRHEVTFPAHPRA